MTTEGKFERFLAVGAAVVAAGAITSAAFVMIMDPYRLYSIIERTGINQVKPVPTRYQNEIKLHGAIQRKADTFILGNSRAEIGFNPEHPALGTSAYNLALAGTRLTTARGQLEYLDTVGVAPARLVIGVEFLDFLIDPGHARPVRAAKPKTAFDDLTWKADALFSIDSLIDSLKTLRLQRASDPQSITARGFNPLLHYNKFAREGGYYPIFQQRAVEYAGRFVRAPRGLIVRASGSSPDIDALRALIAYGIKGNADVDLVIYPYHVQIMAMLEEAGLAGTFEEWKAILVREVATARAANPDARITLWDFSGYSTFQCEAVPAKGDKLTHTKWYWEAGHFKQALGDIMLDRIVGRNSGHESQSFGFELNDGTVASNQVRVSAERAACFAAQPGLFQEAHALVTKARQRRTRTQ